MKIRTFVLLGFLLPSLSFATTVIHFDNAELSQKASAVVRAKILEVKAKEAPGEIKTIFTEIKAKVLEVYKEGQGVSKDDIISLRRLGGKLQKRTFVIPGASQYSVGQESVLFLEKTTKDYFIILGMAQGKFDVVVDPKTKEKMLVRDTLDMNLVKKNGQRWGALSHGDTSSKELKISLRDLEQIIQKNQ